MKALYRIKQARRSWYSRIDSYLLPMGFQKSEADLNLYFIMVGDDPLILLLYVDDLFIKCEERPIAVYKRDIASEYEMTDIELMHYFLGLEVWQEPSQIFLGQGKYAVDILRRFRI